MDISTILINSDSEACNENLSVYIKHVIETVYSETNEENIYQEASFAALRLVTLNLFLKNYHFCLGKILAFFSTFATLTEIRTLENDEGPCFDTEHIKEFLCIVLLLLLKLKNSPQEDDTLVNCLDIIPVEGLYYSLQHFEFVTVIAKFIRSHVVATNESKSSFVLLKFGCDIFFEYLYYSELLTDDEFDELTNNSPLIPTLIKYLLTNENFNTYDLDGDDFDDEAKLIAYEEFKLLLLINEQYLMKSYTCQVENKVFGGLMNDESGPNNSNITGFINLIVFHINREESQIIKILILKFLYLVFTSSSTATLVYLNDLKILVDIFIRELNDLDSLDKENRILLITYLKVLYPLLRFSQLKEPQNAYKQAEIMELLRNLVLNSNKDGPMENDQDAIAKLATRCMSVHWLKKKNSSPRKDHINTVLDESLDLSSDSIDVAIARVASVRTSKRTDFYKHTTSHNTIAFNAAAIPEDPDLFDANNHNIFLQNTTRAKNVTKILDLPNEYLHHKPLPSIPVPPKSTEFYKQDASSSSSVASASLLLRKALKKKAPPPPPPPHHRSNSTSPHPLLKNGTPPPPPPPRRHR